LLLTGNTPAGARAKLEHYGLDRYFQRGGAFCARRENRDEIARAAVALANGSGPELMYVIGDTPHDVRAGTAIGARVIGIATGSQVAAVALRAVGVAPELDLLARVRAAYERRLPDALLLREGAVLPGIRETLDGLAARGRVVSVLLTGNTVAGARAKLERYGL